MHSALQLALASWAVPWIPTLAILITALIYLRGCYLLRCAGFPLLPPWRSWSFLAGLASLWIALAGPMDVFNSWLLTAHMVQHMVLMMIAPPLILLGEPMIPLVRGMPIFAAREFAGPFLNWKPAQRLGRWLTHPMFALLSMGIVMLGWHIPAPYELAVRSPAWHQFEHACFLVSSLIFWWPVIEPWPSHSPWPRWAMVPYLLVADLLNTILSATLVFADHVLYPSYVDAPHVFGLTAHEDQAAAGAIMWVVGSLAFLIPAILIAVQCLARRATLLPVQRLKKRKAVLAGSWQHTMAKLGLGTQRAEALSFLALFIAVALGFWAVLAFAGGDDDDLVLRAKQQPGNLIVSVYAPGDELIVGENDISILVQEAAGSPLPAAQIEVIAVRKDPTQGGEVRGRESDSDNKILQSAAIDIPDAGDWQIKVEAKHGAQTASVSFPAEAIVHTAGFDDRWPYFLFPFFGLLLLAIHVRRGGRRRTFSRERAIEPAASR